MSAQYVAPIFSARLVTDDVPLVVTVRSGRGCARPAGIPSWVMAQPEFHAKAQEAFWNTDWSLMHPLEERGAAVAALALRGSALLCSAARAWRASCALFRRLRLCRSNAWGHWAGIVDRAQPRPRRRRGGATQGGARASRQRSTGLEPDETPDHHAAGGWRRRHADGQLARRYRRARGPLGPDVRTRVDFGECSTLVAPAFGARPGRRRLALPSFEAILRATAEATGSSPGPDLRRCSGSCAALQPGRPFPSGSRPPPSSSSRRVARMLLAQGMPGMPTNSARLPSWTHTNNS